MITFGTSNCSSKIIKYLSRDYIFWLYWYKVRFITVLLIIKTIKYGELLSDIGRLQNQSSVKMTDIVWSLKFLFLRHSVVTNAVHETHYLNFDYFQSWTMSRIILWTTLNEGCFARRELNKLIYLKHYH